MSLWKEPDSAINIQEYSAAEKGILSQSNVH